MVNVVIAQSPARGIRDTTTWITPVRKERKPNVAGMIKGDGTAMTPDSGRQMISGEIEHHGASVSDWASNTGDHQLVKG
jgi:hypothetical protein